MKPDRAFLRYIQRWLNKFIILLPIAVATVAIVLTVNPPIGGSQPQAPVTVNAQSTPTPVAIPTPISIPLPPVISGKTLKIVTRIVPPFVTEENGELGGFSIELWRNIARELELKSEFQKTSNVTDLLTAIKSRQAEVGISAISVTAQRERDFDFSQPIFDSGLQILVRSQGTQSSLGRLFDSLFTPEFFQLLGIMLLVILIPAHIVWLVERKHEGGFLENSAYFPGIFKACWWGGGNIGNSS